jgi:hypothetical protein
MCAEFLSENVDGKSTVNIEMVCNKLEKFVTLSHEIK